MAGLPWFDGLHWPDLHATRVHSLKDARLAVIAGAPLAVSLIGQAVGLA